MTEKINCIRAGCHGFAFLDEEYETTWGIDDLYYVYECSACGLRGKKYSEYGASPKTRAKNNFITGEKDD